MESLCDYPVLPPSGGDIEFVSFSGGGVSGIGHIGALKELEEFRHRENIDYWLGSSAGSIVATFAAMGVTADRLMEEVLAVNPSSFFPTAKSKMIGNLHHLIENLGVTNGEEIDEWLMKKIEESGFSRDVTFRELYRKTGQNLITTITRLNRYETLYASHYSFPTMKVMDAIHSSITLPYLFQPTVMGGDILIDGGVLDNLPINACDIMRNGKILGYNRKAVGFTIINNGKWCPDRVDIDNLLNYSYTFVSAMHTKIQMLQSHQPYFWNRVVPIDTGDVKTLSFDVDCCEMKRIMDVGRRSTRRYLENRERNLPGNMFIPVNGEYIDNDDLSYAKVCVRDCKKFNENGVDEDILEFYS